MLHIHHHHHSSSSSNNNRPAATVLILVLASLALAACGSSAKSAPATSVSASASTTGGARGAFAGRFAALRECLHKHGITPPKHAAGQRPSPGGGFLGGFGAPQLPKGMTSAQYEAILKQCGGGFFRGRLPGGGARGGGAPGIGSRLHSPVFTQALAKFATCMREHGVRVPAPNTSGKGPIFDTKGLDVQSSAFRTAETKCSSDLADAFRARPGAAGAGG